MQQQGSQGEHPPKSSNWPTCVPPTTSKQPAKRDTGLGLTIGSKLN